MSIFRGSMYFSGILDSENTFLVAVFVIGATIQRFQKKGVLKILLNSEEMPLSHANVGNS